jgi:anti-anti-sigma factor
LATELKYVRVNRQAGVTIFTFTVADLSDEETFAAVKAELLSFTKAERPANILMDFRHVQRLNSAVVGLLVLLRKGTIAAAGALKLCSFPPTFRDVFEVCGNFKPFEMFDDLTEAVKSFGPINKYWKL